MGPTPMRLSVAASRACSRGAGPASGPRLAQERAALIAAAADLKFALAEIAGAFTRDTGKHGAHHLRVVGRPRAPDRAGRAVRDAPLGRRALRLRPAPSRAHAWRGRALCHRPARRVRAARLAADAGRRPARPPVGGRRRPRHALRHRQPAARAVRQGGPGGPRAARRLAASPAGAGAWRERLPGHAVRGVRFVPGRYRAALARPAPDIAKLGTFERIPAAWHSPLRQRMVLMARAGPVAAAFYDYLQHNAGVAQTLARFGFALPDGK